MKTKNNILIPDSISGPRIPFWVPVTLVLVVVLTVFVVRKVKHISAASEEAVLTRSIYHEGEHLLDARILPDWTIRCDELGRGTISYKISTL